MGSLFCSLKKWAGLILFVLTVVACMTSLVGTLKAAGKGEPGPVFPTRVEIINEQIDLKLFYDLGLDIDGVFDGWARLYLNKSEKRKLEELGYILTELPDEGKIGKARMAEEGIAAGIAGQYFSGAFEDVPAQYHTYATLTADLQTIAADHPNIARLTSIGQSYLGDKELWFMKITDNPDDEEDEPEVVYIAAMHGNEVVGKEMTFNLINYITDNYGVDPRITELVDENEIWIMPSMNPDGTALGQRYNAQGYDLNRDFPDYYDDPVNTPDGRAVETQLMMAWTEEHTPILSANFHGGALVINYPFDNNPSNQNIPSPTPDPDDAAFISISTTYASNNPPMYNSPIFPGGITNGADWYHTIGCMQDWNYVWYGNFHVTAEISNTKWPSASTLPGFWDDNLESMLSYFERANHEGLRGVVTDALTGTPVAATVKIDDNPFPSYTDPDVGDYHRVVVLGTNKIKVSAVGYLTEVVEDVVIAENTLTTQNVALQRAPIDLQVVKTVDQTAPFPGDAIEFTITVVNHGYSAATNVSLKDVLPAGLTYVSHQAWGDSTYDAETTSASYGVWQIGDVPGVVAEGLDGPVLAIRATVDERTEGELITNTTSELTSDQTQDSGDIDPTNDVGEVTVAVGIGPDLQVVKAVDKDQARPGGIVMYTITIVNGGTRTATGITIDDALPAGLLYSSADASQGSVFYDDTTATLSWDVGELPGGDLVSVGIAVTVSADTGSTEIVNSTSNLVQDGSDPFPDNNVGTVTIAVLGEVAGSQEDSGLIAENDLVADAGGCAALGKSRFGLFVLLPLLGLLLLFCKRTKYRGTRLQLI